MNSELAIKLLRKETSADEICWLKELGYKRAEIVDMIQDAMDMGIEAIEKQIPKKPIEIIERSWNNAEGLIRKCSVCGDEVSKGQYYCCECGQKLNWSEVE